MEGNRQYCEFEAAGAAEDLLALYDPVSDKWQVPMAGPFWEAINRAHDSGQRLAPWPQSAK
jgi:hypothetical protein